MKSMDLSRALIYSSNAAARCNVDEKNFMERHEFVGKSNIWGRMERMTWGDSVVGGCATSDFQVRRSARSA